MEKIFVLYLVFPLWMIIIFQPYLDRLEEARDIVNQVALERATEKAAIEGYYTDEIVLEMKDLVKRVGYRDEDIEFDGTSLLTDRGNYIQGTLKVPNVYQHILISSILERKDEPDAMYHVSSATRMSEYIN